MKDRCIKRFIRAGCLRKLQVKISILWVNRMIYNHKISMILKCVRFKRKLVACWKLNFRPLACWKLNFPPLQDGHKKRKLTRNLTFSPGFFFLGSHVHARYRFVTIHFSRDHSYKVVKVKKARQLSGRICAWINTSISHLDGEAGENRFGYIWHGFICVIS